MECVQHDPVLQQQANAILARMYTVVCAWCGVTLEAGDPALISHGICPECAAKVEGL